MEIERIGVGILIFYFVVYLIGHIGLGYILKYYQKLNNEKPGNIETEIILKYLQIGFTWFPAIFVLIIKIFHL